MHAALESATPVHWSGPPFTLAKELTRSHMERAHRREQLLLSAQQKRGILVTKLSAFAGA